MFLFLFIDAIQLITLFSVVLCVIIIIEAVLFFLLGSWINVSIEILFLAKIFVIDAKTPGLSLTSNLK